MSGPLLTGALLSLLGALFFGFNNLATRRAVVRVKDTSPGVALSVFVSVPAVLAVLVLTGKLGDLIRFPWHSYLWLLGAGIIHYYVGRSLNYRSVQLVGANLTGILRRSSPLMAVFLGVVVLGETVTGTMLFGLLLILLGVGLVGWTPWQPRGGKNSFLQIGPKGVLLGIGAGVCYGISPLMIKMALNSYSAPLAAVLITFVGAAAVFAVSSMAGRKRAELFTMEKATFWWFVISGLVVVLAQVSRFLALSMAPISIVSPLFDTSPIMVVILSFFFNRKLEVFSKSIVFSAIVVVIGSLFLIWG
jgi:drug/metabolite transporter (DMT)-like permease